MEYKTPKLAFKIWENSDVHGHLPLSSPPPFFSLKYSITLKMSMAFSFSVLICNYKILGPFQSWACVGGCVNNTYFFSFFLPRAILKQQRAGGKGGGVGFSSCLGLLRPSGVKKGQAFVWLVPWVSLHSLSGQRSITGFCFMLLLLKTKDIQLPNKKPHLFFLEFLLPYFCETIFRFRLLNERAWNR